MLRKLSLVAIAAASLGVAALAPTSASAWGGGGWHGGWHGGGWGWGRHFYVGGPAYSYGYGGCYPPTAMVTAAAMCGNWFRPPGDPVGGW